MTRRVRSPLPQRHGLDAVWVRTPALVAGEPLPWRTIAEFLHARLPAVSVQQWLAQGRFVNACGRPLTGDEPCEPAMFVWFHKDLAPEPWAPGDLPVLYRDERILVIDKPHFLATTPRGVHVRQTALVKLRVAHGLPELSPAHRLDRLTAGVLLFTVSRQWRRPYQQLFEDRAVTKTYEALARARDELVEPRLIRSHIVKRRGALQADSLPPAADHPVNAETAVVMTSQVDGVGTYTLRPRTGRTHQLRVHMCGLGAPIIGDPLYPHVTDVPEDVDEPLRLVARTLEFTDPVDGSARQYSSQRPLGLPRCTR